ncbi:MAG: regulatory iron-sulfur-containing complex subunit RicT [Gemmatimonadota bacterium]
MPQTVEVRFKGTRRDFFVWPDESDPLRLKEAVVVQLDRGLDLGRVYSAGATAEKKCASSCSGCSSGAKPNGTEVSETSEAAPAAEPASPRPILRRATQEDIRAANELRLSEETVRRKVIERVRHHGLDMKVSDTEWQWDRNKLTIFFTAEKRVDFRTLVRDLAAQFRARIELRQIGVRDEAARLTGVGRCGREYCCSTWLKELSPVSLALAKDQHLSLNPQQISGGCGRLLCCLKYEHEFYVASRRRFPKEGKAVQTAVGSEKVISVDIFRERVLLRSEENVFRVVQLLELKEEVERAALLGPPLPTEASSTAVTPPRTAPVRPAARGGDSRSSGSRGGSSRNAGRPIYRPPLAEQTTTGSVEPTSSPPTPRVEPTRGAVAPIAPGSGTNSSSEAGAPPDPEHRSEAGASRPRRRRRGRRGRSGPPGAPETPPSPEN